jgi:hypothetical protein
MTPTNERIGTYPEQERIAITVDGQEVAVFVCDKSPFPRRHVLEVSDMDSGTKYYRQVQTGEFNEALYHEWACRTGKEAI